LIKQVLAKDRWQGTTLAVGHAGQTFCVNQTSSIKIMVSAWWLLWAFVAGGYAGMLLVALIAIARKAPARGSAFE
jgi:hypothetical protein